MSDDDRRTAGVHMMVRQSLRALSLVMADAEANPEVPPYNLPVPGSSNDVLTELVLAHDHLARVRDALSAS